MNCCSLDSDHELGIGRIDDTSGDELEKSLLLEEGDVFLSMRESQDLEEAAAIEGTSVEETAMAGAVIEGTAVEEAAIGGTAMEGEVIEGTAVEEAAIGGTAMEGEVIGEAAFEAAEVEVQGSDLPSGNVTTHGRVGVVDGLMLCLCGKKYIHSYSLNRHLRKERGTEYNCDTCGKPFADKFHMNEHIRVDHVGMRYSCNLCEREFKSKHALRLHKDSHEGKYRFMCSFCGQGFNYLAIFDAHVNRHLGEKPYACDNDLCIVSFHHQSDLARHKQTCGKKDKPFVCDQCGKRYTDKRYLTDHVRSHSKTYQCERCGKSYPYPQSLRKHKIKCMSS